MQCEVPSYVRSAIVDKTVGLMALSAMLAALWERAVSGRGQAVDVPMFESMVAMNSMEQMGGLVHVPPDGPAGYARTASPHRKPYAPSDGYLAALVYTDRQWTKFFALAGRQDLASDPRLSTIRGRTEHIDEFYVFLEEILRSRTTAEWQRVFDEADIPAMPVLSLTELIEDPQVLASGLYEPVRQPVAGELRQPGVAWRFGRTAVTPAGPAPMLSEHDAAIRAEVREAAGPEVHRAGDGPPVASRSDRHS